MKFLAVPALEWGYRGMDLQYNVVFIIITLMITSDYSHDKILPAAS